LQYAGESPSPAFLLPRWFLVEATHFSKATAELGIQQILARWPQAKGQVEGTAETFQDRLVTELRLGGARTIYQANAVLQDFLPRYNTRFVALAELTVSAYRSRIFQHPLDEILCFKHPRKVSRNDAVQCQWRTLQRLPGTERPSHAGV